MQVIRFEHERFLPREIIIQEAQAQFERIKRKNDTSYRAMFYRAHGLKQLINTPLQFAFDSNDVFVEHRSTMKYHEDPQNRYFGPISLQRNPADTLFPFTDNGWWRIEHKSPRTNNNWELLYQRAIYVARLPPLEQARQTWLNQTRITIPPHLHPMEMGKLDERSNASMIRWTVFPSSLNGQYDVTITWPSTGHFTLGVQYAIVEEQVVDNGVASGYSVRHIPVSVNPFLEVFVFRVEKTFLEKPTDHAIVDLRSEQPTSWDVAFLNGSEPIFPFLKNTSLIQQADETFSQFIVATWDVSQTVTTGIENVTRLDIDPMVFGFYPMMFASIRGSRVLRVFEWKNEPIDVQVPRYGAPFLLKTHLNDRFQITWYDPQGEELPEKGPGLKLRVVDPKTQLGKYTARYFWTDGTTNLEWRQEFILHSPLQAFADNISERTEGPATLAMVEIHEFDSLQEFAGSMPHLFRYGRDLDAFFRQYNLNENVQLIDSVPDEYEAAIPAYLKDRAPYVHCFIPIEEAQKKGFATTPKFFTLYDPFKFEWINFGDPSNPQPLPKELYPLLNMSIKSEGRELKEFKLVDLAAESPDTQKKFISSPFSSVWDTPAYVLARWSGQDALKLVQSLQRKLVLSGFDQPYTQFLTKSTFQFMKTDEAQRLYPQSIISVLKDGIVAILDVDHLEVTVYIITPKQLRERFNIEVTGEKEVSDEFDPTIVKSLATSLRATFPDTPEQTTIDASITHAYNRFRAKPLVSLSKLLQSSSTQEEELTPLRPAISTANPEISDITERNLLKADMLINIRMLHDDALSLPNQKVENLLQDVRDGPYFQDPEINAVYLALSDIYTRKMNDRTQRTASLSTLDVQSLLARLKAAEQSVRTEQSNKASITRTIQLKEAVDNAQRVVQEAKRYVDIEELKHQIPIVEGVIQQAQQTLAQPKPIPSIEPLSTLLPMIPEIDDPFGFSNWTPVPPPKLPQKKQHVPPHTPPSKPLVTLLPPTPTQTKPILTLPKPTPTKQTTTPTLPPPTPVPERDTDNEIARQIRMETQNLQNTTDLPEIVQSLRNVDELFSQYRSNTSETVVDALDDLEAERATKSDFLVGEFRKIGLIDIISSFPTSSKIPPNILYDDIRGLKGEIKDFFSYPLKIAYGKIFPNLQLVIREYRNITLNTSNYPKPNSIYRFKQLENAFTTMKGVFENPNLNFEIQLKKAFRLFLTERSNQLGLPTPPPEVLKRWMDSLVANVESFLVPAENLTQKQKIELALEHSLNLHPRKTINEFLRDITAQVAQGPSAASSSQSSTQKTSLTKDRESRILSSLKNHQGALSKALEELTKKPSADAKTNLFSAINSAKDELERIENFQQTDPIKKSISILNGVLSKADSTLNAAQSSPPKPKRTATAPPPPPPEEPEPSSEGESGSESPSSEDEPEEPEEETPAEPVTTEPATPQLKKMTFEEEQEFIQKADPILVNLGTKFRSYKSNPKKQTPDNLKIAILNAYSLLASYEEYEKTPAVEAMIVKLNTAIEPGLQLLRERKQTLPVRRASLSTVMQPASSSSSQPILSSSTSTASTSSSQPLLTSPTFPKIGPTLWTPVTGSAPINSTIKYDTDSYTVFSSPLGISDSRASFIRQFFDQRAQTAAGNLLKNYQLYTKADSLTQERVADLVRLLSVYFHNMKFVSNDAILFPYLVIAYFFGLASQYPGSSNDVKLRKFIEDVSGRIATLKGKQGTPIELLASVGLPWPFWPSIANSSLITSQSASNKDAPILMDPDRMFQDAISEAPFQMTNMTVQNRTWYNYGWWLSLVEWVLQKKGLKK
jgi:hypothetical protein